MTRESMVKAVMALSILLSGGAARAGVPFINLEGVGGVAFNPLAYAATDGETGIQAGVLEVAKPRIGVWYVNLNQPSIDWTAVGVATSFNKRLEVSFGYEALGIGELSGNSHKENVGAKLVLLNENALGTNFLPAVSVGTVWKHTNYTPLAALMTDDSSGLDFYAVATKLVTQLPVPVLLSAGVLSTKAMVNGVIGFNSERAFVAFANIDFVPVSFLAVGAEYKMGPNYGAAGGGYEDHDYFELHAGWFATKNLTIIAAYANAGTNQATAMPVGFGPGFVLAGQYAF